MKAKLAILSLVILFASCEDVIEIDLNDMEPKLVVDALISLDNQCVVKLSKTTDYFSEQSNPMVSDAVVILDDNAGTIVTLREIEPGVYSDESMLGKQKTTYTLKIISEGKEYNSTATIPQLVSIDSLSYKYNDEELFYDFGYVVKCHFPEPLEIENYYRIKTYNLNDETKADDSEFIFDDDLFNGNNVEIAWEDEVFQLNDSVVVELYTLDLSTYDYYKTLFQISGSESFMSTPANPVTNISNGALGYFGAYTISRATIVISGN